MCILPLSPAVTTAVPETQPAAACPAEQLSPQQRQRLALDALAGQPISDLARRHGVSRQFVYRQQQIALAALASAFAPEPATGQEILFFLPITSAWLEQLVLALVLIGHSSLRGVQELLRDLFDYPISLGSLHNLVQQAITKATLHNAQQDLRRVREAALDEIFQHRQPILSVVDVASTYCCLLSLEEQRDADTWAIRLLELHDQGFDPATTIGDGGKGLRGGQKRALPDTPCRADVFHALRDLGQVARFLENRAYAALSTYDELQRRLSSPQRRPCDDPSLLEQRDAAEHELIQALTLADDVAVLARWLQRDVLSVAGPCLAQRQELFDFVLAELKARQPLCPHRLKPVCSALKKQRAELLAFVEDVDRDIGSLAAWARVPEAVVREMVAVQELPISSALRWQREAVLRQQLGERYRELRSRVEALRAGVVRASSVVENVNSRLRNYFFLRKEVGQGCLELLRFFLNHRRFLRSKHAERVGQSPAELLSGRAHRHWLELLGYRLFRQTT
jgi:transposase-like protein